MKTSTISNYVARKLVTLAALTALVLSMGASWSFGTTAFAAPAVGAAAIGDGAAGAASKPARSHKPLAGRLNLNTASEDQLQVLPTVGPAKAERIVTWRKKNGGFKRIADLRRVKGFGYKTMKKLEPYLDIKGDTTLTDR